MTNAASTSNPSVTVNVNEAYPNPSHAIGPNFFTMKLSGKDTYSVWETQILSLLWSQHMVGFIEDQFPSPAGNEKGKVGDIDAWIASDSLVKGWILGSLSDGVAKKVVNRLKTIHKNTYFTAKDLWDQLQRSYGPSNCKQAADSLVKGWIIGSLSEEARKAVNYLIHMEKDPDFKAKDLWDELQRSYGPSVREQAVAETKSPTRQTESAIEESSISEDADSEDGPTEEKTEEEAESVIEESSISEDADSEDGPTEEKTEEEAESAIEESSISEDADSEDGPTEQKTEEEAESVIEVSRLLYGRILRGKTTSVINQMEKDRINPWVKIRNNGNTILHVAVSSSTENHELLKTLLDKTPKEKLLDLMNSDGSTPLHVAVIGGNIKAVNMLVERNPELLLAKDKEGHTPLALSISNMHTKTSKCLYGHMKVHRYLLEQKEKEYDALLSGKPIMTCKSQLEPKYDSLLDGEDIKTSMCLVEQKEKEYDALFTGKSGEDLVILAISCQDFRLARQIIDDYRGAAILDDSDALLTALAQNFPRELNFWEIRDFRRELSTRIDFNRSTNMRRFGRALEYNNACWTVISQFPVNFLVGFHAIVTAFLLFLKAIVHPFINLYIENEYIVNLYIYHDLS